MPKTGQISKGRMKLAVAGKGGVGKTTLVVLLAREVVTRRY